MKITTAAEMSAIDRATSQEHGIHSLALMENAGSAVANFCSRALAGCQPDHRGLWPGQQWRRWICRCPAFARSRQSGGGSAARFGRGTESRTPPTCWRGLPLRPVVFASVEDVAREYARSLAGADLIIDAIFGTGYQSRATRSRQRRSLADAAITAINRSSAPVLSVDLPSGWDADITSSTAGPRSLGLPLQCCDYFYRAQACAHVCPVDARRDRGCAHRNARERDCLRAESLRRDPAGGLRSVRTASVGQQQRAASGTYSSLEVRRARAGPPPCVPWRHCASVPDLRPWRPRPPCCPSLQDSRQS